MNYYTVYTLVFSWISTGSLYVFELNVDVSKVKIMSILQQRFYGEFTSPATINVT
jgi:hypothetical protein